MPHPRQHAPVGAAACAATGAALKLLERAAQRGLDVGELHARQAARADAAGLYDQAWRRYGWPVEGLEGLKLAPFQLLAGEGSLHAAQDHRWHMQTLAELCAVDPDLLLATDHREVATADEQQVEAAIAWWFERTGQGAEGMVVKPREPIARGKRGLVQPAVKCRGREYLRIIYGPEYLLPENIARLRKRGLGRKRSLALTEFALGLEALERFIAREPLHRVHECCFALLACESEPIDPRL